MGHWLVLDLEATTEEGGWPVEEMEIIEIGACLVDAKGREIDHFQRFVRPLRRPLLTTFCRELTQVTQNDIDAARPLSQVWPAFERWLEPHHPRLQGWASWGDYDRQQLHLEWQRQRLGSHLSSLAHTDLKRHFAKVRQLKRPVGLHAALALAGMSFQGQQHRALDDARNTARLLPLAFDGRTG